MSSRIPLLFPNSYLHPDALQLMILIAFSLFGHISFCYCPTCFDCFFSTCNLTVFLLYWIRNHMIPAEGSLLLSVSK